MADTTFARINLYHHSYWVQIATQPTLDACIGVFFLYTQLMAKSNTIFFCSSCGNEYTKWSGQCPACKGWNTLTESTSVTKIGKSKSISIKPATTTNLNEALAEQKTHTFTSQIGEVDRVLGPGFTRGGVYLLAGQPGIGKSTLLTQIATLATKPIFYICSEESPSQVATRIKRLTSKNTNIQLVSSSVVEEITNLMAKNQDSIFIVDSIQSVFFSQNATSAGSPSQIRDSANYLIQSAKQNNITTIIVGHVTKEGSIAGPKMLEHMVDVVLELTGDRQHLLRVLHSIKNRFGPTDESGLFQMAESGLLEVNDPGKFLLEDRVPSAPGSCLTLTMQGTRPITIEIQALVVHSPLPVPRRIAKGVSTNRLQLICAILTKHLNLPLATKDVFVNVTGGLDIKDPGADLGIALAIISSTKDKPLPDQSICFGELGLLGEIRKVNYTDKLQKEAKTLGYKTIFSPINHKNLKNIKI